MHPYASCAGSKSSPQAQKLSASRLHASTREERIHYRHGRRGCRRSQGSSPYATGVTQQPPWAMLLATCAACSASRTGARPCAGPYAASLMAGRGGPAARRAARRGGALCGLTRGGPRHVEALRAVRVAQAAQLARRAGRDNGALCVRGQVARLRIRLLPQIATQSWSCTINLRPGHSCPSTHCTDATLSQRVQPGHARQPLCSQKNRGTNGV